jgi:multiple sugar transport system permease protein
MWILDPAFSVINWFLVHLGMARPGPSWLGNSYLAMASVIVVNTWRGLPFFAITLLAGLQTIPNDLYDAATIDGTDGWQRFRYVTLPLVQPVLLIVTMFSVIFTFSDFQLIYVLTHGGPANATQLFATYSFDIAMSAGQLGHGASVALAMLPALGLLIVALTIYMRRR